MVAASAALLAVPFAAPASALTSSVSCKTEGSSLKGGKAISTFAGCTTALKGGTGLSPKTPPAGTKKGQLSLVITWNGGTGKTTVAFGFATQTKPLKCKGGSSRVLVSGKVLSATGAAKAITKAGEPVTATSCVYASGPKVGQSYVYPGTTFKL